MDIYKKKRLVHRSLHPNMDTAGRDHPTLYFWRARKKKDFLDVLRIGLLTSKKLTLGFFLKYRYFFFTF